MEADRALVINGGSSTVKFAVYGPGEPLTRVLKGQVEHLGDKSAMLTTLAQGQAAPVTRSIEAADHKTAANKLIDWIEESNLHGRLVALGHRVVHGGLRLNQHQRITPQVVSELRDVQSLDLAHLPREIALIEAFQSRFPDLPQVACFDTAFHRDLPRLAQLLPIPRRYLDGGVRRLGFHGLSYTYLLEELNRRAGPNVANGRVILAHLGSGASMAALSGGVPVDTTMGFTPTGGLTMGTRPGDLDPGLLVYMMREEKLGSEEMDGFLSRECGLYGVSGGTSDVRELIERRATDTRAAEALDLFCYQAKKWLGAFIAVLGGLETLVFSGGIGEHSPAIRAGICGGLEGLGLQLDADRNAASAPIISSEESRVNIRVIPTDEEALMARIAFGMIEETV